MKLERIGAGLVALMALGFSMTGCGGGSEGEDLGDGEVSRQLLAGDGATSGEGVTTKNWRVAALVGNHNYGGASSACPAKFESTVDSSQVLECSADDKVTISSNGKFTFLGWGKSWVLRGNQVTLDFGGAIGTQVSEVVTEVVGGKQRIRLMQVSFTKDGVVRPHDNGSTIILEEAPM